MKKSEFKEYLKTEILKMSEATAEDVKNQKEYNAELEKTKELEDSMNENKITKSEFKEYLRNEILREINEQEEEEDIDLDVDADLGGDDEEFDGNFEIEEEGADISGLSDELVDLAKKAKDAGAIELANQILNSAKFANKTKIKSAEKEAGLSTEG